MPGNFQGLCWCCLLEMGLVIRMEVEISRILIRRQKFHYDANVRFCLELTADCLHVLVLKLYQYAWLHKI